MLLKSLFPSSPGARNLHQFSLVKRLLDANERGKNLLYLMIIVGIYFFFPGQKSSGFHPGSLILVIFPIIVILISWVYVKMVARGFSVVSRELPAVCLENEFIEVQVNVSYTSPIPFSNASLSENFPAVDILSSPEVTMNFATFASDGRAKICYRHQLNRGYGEFTIGPSEIVIQDPFGFFERKLTFPLTSKLKVWLNPPSPKDLDLVKANALTPMGDSKSVQSGHGMDFYGIKEYLSGDDIRAMSWLKTAQTGKPIIKQFERDTRPDVFLVMHTDRKQLRGLGFGNTMKRVFRLSAAVIGETQQRGLSGAIGLCIDDDAHYLKLNSSVPVYGFMTELLSDLKPAEEGGLEKLVNLAMIKAGPGSIVIFLSQTLNLNIDVILSALISLKARGARVALWAIDDTDQVRFSEDQNLPVSKDEFKARLHEMDLELLLFPSKKVGDE